MKQFSLLEKRINRNESCQTVFGECQSVYEGHQPVVDKHINFIGIIILISLVVMIYFLL
jgi:hypothetical protein